MSLVRREAVGCGRNHDKGKPQAKCGIILDHEVLISEAELISKIAFIFNSLGSFSDSHKKCFVHHIVFGVVDTKQQKYTCGPSVSGFKCRGCPGARMLTAEGLRKCG